MRPHGAVVVRERVVAEIILGHRPHAPARPEPVAHQGVHDRVDALVGDDAAPQEVPDVRAERVDLLLAAVERERVVAAPLLAPERLVELALQLVGLGVETRPELAVAPHFTGELRGPAFRVVDVALNLARRDRRLRNRPVVEAL